eukprot:1181913-Pleurochrysis_carterae.AAC.1
MSSVRGRDVTGKRALVMLRWQHMLYDERCARRHKHIHGLIVIANTYKLSSTDFYFYDNTPTDQLASSQL